MRETPRPQGTADDSGAERPQRRSGRAIAHTTGASGSGTPHRSDGRPLHTPRGERHTDLVGRPGTIPPVPGRPNLLSRAFALCVVLLALFALVTWQAAAGGPLRTADERLDRALVGHGPRALTEALADLGSMPVALPVLALAAGYALWRGQRARALAAAVTMAVVPALVVPLKIWTDRPGPLTDATGYYPSGHTATAMVAYGAAALLLTPYAGARGTAPAAAVLTVATGTGLILRGYHWPLDVLGSLLLCGILLLLLALVLNRIGPDGAGRRTRRGTPGTPAG
ncbi:phosphatase PAP2 family protein [Streptomyces sp. NPDC088725]|uniref:phosphatase PAP2 family protein n=1 Tax=Streptomyces sp. NPDC088725 TaxID=3365873 RepID=UPI00381A7650